MDNGGEELPAIAEIKNCKVANFLGNTEIFFYTDTYFAGIRGEAAIEDLKPIIIKLFENLSK
jgi:hypothetical protein